jgi:hypothetical protein
MPQEKGLAGYGAGHAYRPPKQIVEAYLEKCRLRSQIAALQVEIESAVQALDATELRELHELMQTQVEASDVEDVAAMCSQVREEAELAKSVFPMQVSAPRRGVLALSQEVQRRIQRGVFPNASNLVTEALIHTFEA